MPLTDRQINNSKPLQKPTKDSDGGGLHLLVSSAGRKFWRLAYRFGGKQKLLSFGAYPAIGFAEASAKREAANELLVSGVDPSFQAKQDMAAGEWQQNSDIDRFISRMVAMRETATGIGLSRCGRHSLFN